MRAIRIVGPPGSGKTLLITALVEALRPRGLRTTSVVQRLPEYGSPGGTVFTLGSGARATIDQLISLAAARDLARTLDSTAALLLAEGYHSGENIVFPAVVVHDDTSPTGDPNTGDVIATVDGTDLARRFPVEGAAAVTRVADAIEAYLRRTESMP